MDWRRSGDKPLSEPMMVSLPTHICVIRPQRVNSVALAGHASEQIFLKIVYDLKGQQTAFSNIKYVKVHKQNLLAKLHFNSYDP